MIYARAAALIGETPCQPKVLAVLSPASGGGPATGADESYHLLREDSRRPSLHFKKIGRFWTVRVGLHYRALAVQREADVVWFWVGPHAEYDRLIGQG